MRKEKTVTTKKSFLLWTIWDLNKQNVCSKLPRSIIICFSFESLKFVVCYAMLQCIITGGNSSSTFITMRWDKSHQQQQRLHGWIGEKKIINPNEKCTNPWSRLSFFNSCHSETFFSEKTEIITFYVLECINFRIG